MTDNLESAGISEDVSNKAMVSEVESEKIDTFGQIADNVEQISENVNEEESNFSNTDAEFDAMMRNDIAELATEFPELSELRDITELENPIRYAALRDLGLSATEAYLATSRKRYSNDNRSHLTGTVPRAASVPKGSISESELAAARSIFGNIPDSEIRRLYKKVTK